MLARERRTQLAQGDQRLAGVGVAMVAVRRGELPDEGHQGQRLKLRTLTIPVQND